LPHTAEAANVTRLGQDDHREDRTDAWHGLQAHEVRLRGQARGDLHFQALPPFAVLDPDLVVRADMAVPSDAPTQVRGAAVWAKGAVAYGHLAQLTRPALVDGAIGVVVAPRGKLVRALRFTVADGKITEIEVIGNPARLGELDVSIVE
jgi:hypothetical protein